MGGEKGKSLPAVLGNFAGGREAERKWGAQQGRKEVRRRAASGQRRGFFAAQVFEAIGPLRAASG